MVSLEEQSNRSSSGIEIGDFASEPPSYTIVRSPESQDASSATSFKIIWKDLCYQVNTFSLQTHIANKLQGTVPESYEQRILKGISGSAVSGQMTALMGPSGAGKTVLLECLIGKRVAGLYGQAILQSNTENPITIKMAIIPQMDNFFNTLTLKETMMFASRLKNPDLTFFEHENLVNDTIKRLGLEDSKDKWVEQLRLGQRKKLAVGAELLSKPNFLVLDECTTGLDSYSAASVIDFLYDLAVEEGLAVLCSIHNPSWSVVKKFHKVYMLSPMVGKAIFEGNPDSILPHLQSFGLTTTGATAEFITDVSAGIHEAVTLEVLNQLSDYQEKEFQSHFQHFIEGIEKENNRQDWFRILSESTTRMFPFFFTHLWILLNRQMLVTFRDRGLITTIIISYVAFAWLYVALFDSPGESDGCPPEINRFVTEVSPFNAYTFRKIVKETDRRFDEMKRNSAMNLFTSLSSMVFVMAPILFKNPVNVPVYWKEVKNGYYSPFILFLAITICDICTGCLLNIIFGSSVYFASKQTTDDNWGTRILVFTFNIAISSFILQSFAQAASSAFCYSIESSIFSGCIFYSLQILFCGFFKFFPDMNGISVALSFLACLRWTVALTRISIYGYDRCGYDGGYSRVIALKDVAESWSLKILNVISQEEGRTMFVGDNENLTFFQNNPTSMSFVKEETQGITISLIISLIKFFVSPEGKIFSLGLQGGYRDEDDTEAISYLILFAIVYRTIALFIFYYRLKQRF